MDSENGYFSETMNESEITTFSLINNENTKSLDRNNTRTENKKNMTLNFLITSNRLL